MFINTASAVENTNQNNNVKTDNNDIQTQDRLLKDQTDKVIKDKPIVNDTMTNNVVGVRPSDANTNQNNMYDSLSPWTSLIPIALMFSVFYWFLIRPQEKRRREQEELIRSVRTGDKVITAGGIQGVVSKVVDDNTIDLEIAPNTNIRIMKSAILEIPSRKLNDTNVV